MFSDADFGGDPSKISTSGYVVALVGIKFGSFAVIHASSSRQRCVSLSTAEAEIIALRAALHFTMCLLPTVESMFTDQINVRIFVDSKAAIQISEKGLSRKLGHVRKLQQVSIRWIKDALQFVSLAHVTSEDNTADVLTKAISAADTLFHYVCGMMMVVVSTRSGR